jgi:hypothetical protein
LALRVYQMQLTRFQRKEGRVDGENVDSKNRQSRLIGDPWTKRSNL